MESNLNNQKIKNDENISNNNSKEDEINEDEIQEINNISNNENDEGINNNINTENKNEENIDEPIYVMTLALEHGKSEKIEIYENSDPAQLAYNFCSKNNLDFTALDYLKEQITNLLESYAKNENEEEFEKNIEQTGENFEENENNNEDINIPEIEEVQESQEFNITENNKENTKNSKKNENEILNNEIIGEINVDELQNSKKNSNNKNERNKIDIKEDLNNEKDEIFNENISNNENKDNFKMTNNNVHSDDLNLNINKNETNENINEEYLVEINDKFEENKQNENLDNKEMYLTNSNNKNIKNKRNYKINEDIIIGMGDYDINDNKSINKSENIDESNDLYKIKNYNINILEENKNNSNNDQKYDENNLYLRPVSKKISEQILTNNFNQETKTNTYTNNNIIQNEEEENNNMYTPKNIQCLYQNNKNETNKIKKELPENTEKILNYKKINKIKHQEKNISNSDKRKNTKNFIQFLSDRNKIIKQEKEEEIKSIKKEIDKIDKRLKKNKNNIMNSNNYLAKNTSMRRMDKIKEEYSQKYSFKPVINDNYKTDLSFNERLKIFNNISKIKKEELKNNYSNLKDKQSGQDFFKPKLISKQFSFTKNKIKNDINNENNEENMDIFNKNYLYWKKYNLDKENLYMKFYEKKNEPIFYSKIISDKLINESNRKAFSNLFNVLDSDQDDLITSVSINLNNIPEKIIKIIQPLLIELKEDNQTLNQDEFIKAMNKLFENISFTDRRELINEYSNYNTKKQNEEKNKLMNKENINNYYHFNLSRSKTPIFIAHNQNMKEKKVVNKNTNKLAEKHFLKMQKMMDVYNNKYNLNLNKKNNINKHYNKTSNSNYNHFFIDNAKNNKFSSINNCTFNNYLKNLN